MRQIDTATNREAIDCQILIVRVLADHAQVRIDHRQHQPIANATAVDLQTVDLEAGISRSMIAMPATMISARSELSPGTLRRDLAGILRSRSSRCRTSACVTSYPAQWQACLPLAGHHHVGQGRERSARADQYVRHEEAFLDFAAQLAIDRLEHSLEILELHVAGTQILVGQATAPSGVV